MRQPDFYRYFLGFRPDFALRRWLESLADAAGQRERRIRADRFHLTLCVIAELQDREERHKRLGQVGHVDGDHVPPPNPEIAQPLRQSCDVTVEFTVGQ